MTVNELIQQLQAMPQGAQVTMLTGDGLYRTPRPEQEWNDHAENYVVVL